MLMEPKIKQQIIDYVKARKPDVVDITLEIVMFDAEHEVLDYCRVVELTDSMVYITSKIVLDLIERDKIKLAQELDTDSKGLKSIKQGDTTMEFVSVAIETNKQIITKYRSDLNKFRRMVF